ncbi:hypothetical protein E2C01_043482 [Portunus trituberculatus]|uniref:CCHC-type domain-containing protein n=1 Tax=Portunus trituberculatus TaxID=210409 RepID=A0A5B7FT35_PORTR|nr:hypothetical protein [Portunus trituberculatus]
MSQQMKEQSQQMKEQSKQTKEQSQEMKKQSQQLRQEMKEKMEQQFYQVASDMQTVQDESKQYTDVKELRGIVEERCACAKEKHWEAPISAIHFKEEVVKDPEDAGGTMKQAQTKDILEVLIRASEKEAFLRTIIDALSLVPPSYEGGTDALPCHVKARRATTGKTNRRRKESPGGFRGGCWGCGKLSHKREQCGQSRRSCSLEDTSRMLLRPCCWRCGQTGHLSRDCQDPKGMVEEENAAGLSSGAKHQLEAMLPHQE